MADSIGQLVVEVALDAKQMYSDLEKTERKLSDTQDNIIKSERKQTDAQRDLKSQIDKTTQTRREETTAVKLETEATKLNTDAVGQQSTGWDNLTDKVKSAKSEFDRLEGPIKNVHKILGPLTSLLGMFGVTIGIQAVISAFQDMADSAKQAREEYTKISEAIGYQTGTLTQLQMQRVNRIANVETGTGYDLTETEKAVGKVDKLYSDLAENQRDNLIKTFLGVAEVTGQSVETIISDISKIANQYKIPVTEVSAMTDNIRVLAQASGASVQDITSIMTQYKSVFDAIGMTDTSDISNAIAGMIQQNRGDVDAVTQQLADYQSQYQQKYTEIATQLRASAQERYMGLIDETSDIYDKDFDIPLDKYLEEQMPGIEQQATTAAKQWASSFATEVRSAMITDLGLQPIVPLDVLLPNVRSADTIDRLNEQSKQIAEWAKNNSIENTVRDAMTTTTSTNAVLQAYAQMGTDIGTGITNSVADTVDVPTAVSASVSSVADTVQPDAYSAGAIIGAEITAGITDTVSTPAAVSIPAPQINPITAVADINIPPVEADVDIDLTPNVKPIGDIDFSPITDAIPDLSQLTNVIGAGVINTDEWALSLANGSTIINGTYIPSASALTTSLYGVADAYNAVADARERAGM